MNRIERYYWMLKTCFMGLKSFGKKSCIFRPMQIDNPQGIAIESSVFIGHYSWLIGAELQSDKGLHIGENTVIGHFAHIVATKQVVIEENVLIADKVFITDCTHNYMDVNKPVLSQPIKFLKEVLIGEGSWIGENVSICGASIGKHCVIGANSVVTKDIPDYCVAAGAPAKIVKYFDKDKKIWRQGREWR